MIHLFRKIVADIIAPKFSIIFCGQIRRGTFPECWWSINVTAIPKGAPSPDRENNHPISITPILSKVYEELVSHKHSSFCEKGGFLPAGLHGLGCTDALSHISSPSDVGMEFYIVLFDFSASFNRVSHSGFLFKLKSICVGGSVLSICRDFLSNSRQRVVVDGATSEWIPIVSDMPQGSVGPVLFILYTSEMFELVKYRL